MVMMGNVHDSSVSQVTCQNHLFLVQRFNVNDMAVMYKHQIRCLTNKMSLQVTKRPQKKINVRQDHNSCDLLIIFSDT